MAAKKSRVNGPTVRDCFILHLKKRCGTRIVPRNDPIMRRIMQMRHYLTEATERINYGCDFKQGKCTRARKVRSKELWDGCCCKDCRRDVGYFENVPEEWITELSKLWNPTTGFYDLKSGCRIPRHMRASTCLAHQCGTAAGKRELTQAEYLLMCSIRASRI